MTSPSIVHAFHLRLRPEKAAEYDSVHATTPEELDAALRRAGARNWSIWRSGLDLFQLIETDEPDAMTARLADDPAFLQWQERLSGFFDGEATGPLPRIWSLPPR